jgi:hypothetical protein
MDGIGWQGCCANRPAGRNHGVAADVRRHPVADRPAAGITRTGMSGAGSLCGKQRREKYASVYANQRNSAFRGLDRRVRALFVGGDGDLPLPNPVNGAILPTKTPGI